METRHPIQKYFGGEF